MYEINTIKGIMIFDYSKTIYANFTDDINIYVKNLSVFEDIVKKKILISPTKEEKGFFFLLNFICY